MVIKQSKRLPCTAGDQHYKNDRFWQAGATSCNFYSTTTNTLKILNRFANKTKTSVNVDTSAPALRITLVNYRQIIIQQIRFLLLKFNEQIVTDKQNHLLRVITKSSVVR